MTEPRFLSGYSYRTKLNLGENYEWHVYGHPANFAYFVNTAPTVATEADAESRTGTRKAHTRRRYKGDTSPSNVSAHGRDFYYDPGRRIGSAIPGWSFILDDGTEKRQFTTDGDVQNLILYLKDEAKMDMRLYTQGASYLIKAATAG